MSGRIIVEIKRLTNSILTGLIAGMNDKTALQYSQMKTKIHTPNAYLIAVPSPGSRGAVIITTTNAPSGSRAKTKTKAV